MDLIIFAGPVFKTPQMSQVPWKRPTKIVVVPGSGSDFFTSMAHSFRDSEGRMLPRLVKKVTGQDLSSFDKIATSSWSAGWGLWNTVFQNPLDRARITAHIALDSAFGLDMPGYVAFAREAVRGQKLLVLTNTNNQANIELNIQHTARQCVANVFNEATRSWSYAQPRPPMPAPVGGLRKSGQLYWFDYVKPGTTASGTGNQFTHNEHFHLVDEAWTAYLAPWLSGELSSFPYLPALAATALVAGSSWFGYKYYKGHFG